MAKKRSVDYVSQVSSLLSSDTVSPAQENAGTAKKRKPTIVESATTTNENTTPVSMSSTVEDATTKKMTSVTGSSKSAEQTNSDTKRKVHTESPVSDKAAKLLAIFPAGTRLQVRWDMAQPDGTNSIVWWGCSVEKQQGKNSTILYDSMFGWEPVESKVIILKMGQLFDYEQKTTLDWRIEVQN